MASFQQSHSPTFKGWVSETPHSVSMMATVSSLLALKVNRWVVLNELNRLLGVCRVSLMLLSLKATWIGTIPTTQVKIRDSQSSLETIHQITWTWHTDMMHSVSSDTLEETYLIAQIIIILAKTIAGLNMVLINIDKNLKASSDSRA